MNVRTLSLISSIISIILSLCMLYVSKTRKTYKGFAQWTAASILYTIGLGLLCTRTILPDLISIIAANTIIIAGSGFIAHGLELFTNTPKKTGYFIFITISMIVLFIYFTYFHPSINSRIIIISAIIIFYYIYSAFIVYKYVPCMIKTNNTFLVAVFIIQSVWLLIRIIQTLSIESVLMDFMNAPIFQSITVIVFFCGNILTTVGLIVLNFQRVEFDWTTAMAEVKTLRGLIPICSSCKKIRDDKGIWNQIEIYIRNHSDAEFTHGICPDCVKKLYPDFAKDMKK